MVTTMCLVSVQVLTVGRQEYRLRLDAAPQSRLLRVPDGHGQTTRGNLAVVRQTLHIQVRHAAHCSALQYCGTCPLQQVGSPSVAESRYVQDSAAAENPNQGLTAAQQPHSQAPPKQQPLRPGSSSGMWSPYISPLMPNHSTAV